MTIGDVMAVVGLVVGICLSLWVMLIGAALLFESKARAARGVWEKQAVGALGVGAGLLLPLGFGTIALLNAPGAFKLLGWLLLLALLAVSLLGGAGLALLMGERTALQDDRLSPFSALSRGAGMMALAWLFPVLGWFLVAPVSLIMGFGAGAKALRKPRKPKHSTPAPQNWTPEPITLEPLAINPLPQKTPVHEPDTQHISPQNRAAGEESCKSPGAIG